MDIGLIFALLAAVSFSGHLVFVRKGVFQTGESFTAILITVFLGTLFFALLLIFSSGWDKLWTLSRYGLALLGIAGVLNLVVGRLLSYSSIRLLGANKATALVSTATFYPVIFGVLWLNETLTIYLGIGVVCIVGGVILISIRREAEVSKIRSGGVLIGLISALCIGMSSVLIKAALMEVDSPSTAVFISFMTASLAIGFLLFRKEQRAQLTQLRRSALIPLMIGGVFSAIGQLLRFSALNYSPVSIVTPLTSIAVLFVFFFSFLLNRNIEVFTWKVFIGMVAIVAGVFLLFQ